MKAQGTKRLTPAFFAASASGICSYRESGGREQMIVSTPVKMLASWGSCLISATWILTSRSLSCRTDGLALEAGRMSASTCCGVRC
jgi:hypothetical protein